MISSRVEAPGQVHRQGQAQQSAPVLAHQRDVAQVQTRFDQCDQRGAVAAEGQGVLVGGFV